MSNPTTTVPTPVRKDRRGGIKSVVGDFVSADRLAVATNLQWVADNCDFPKAAIGLCYAENPVTDNKEFGGLTVGDGPIFALYAGVQCYLGNDTDYEERARAQLEAGEGRGVEEVLWEYGTTRGGTGPAQTSWIAAFAQADEAADTLYVGRPVIMVSRFVAVVARARKAIFGDEEGNLWTANGTPVIASAAASDTTLVVMGWVTVYASGLTSLTVPNPILNQEMALAERVYGIAVDCNFALHYAVTDDGGGGGGGAVTLALTTDPVGEAEVGTPVKAQVTVTGEPTEPILLYTQRNAEEPTLVGEMTSLGGGLYELDADTTGLTAGDVYGFYASHGEATAAVRSPIVTVTLTAPPADNGVLVEITGGTTVPAGSVVPLNVTYEEEPGEAPTRWGQRNSEGWFQATPGFTQNDIGVYGGNFGTLGPPPELVLAEGDVLEIQARLTDGRVSNTLSITVVGPLEDPDEGWTVAELKQFAADHEPPIPIPSTATKKAEILAIILAFLNASDEES